jgi:predicted PurR-regulated permease PerM
MKITLKETNQLLLFIIMLTTVLLLGKPLLVPIIMACLLAMLMAPLCCRLDKKLPRALSALTCVLILLIAISGICTLVSLEISNFMKDLPRIERKTDQLVEQVHNFIDKEIKISPEQQDGIIKKEINRLGNSTGMYIRMLLTGVLSTLSGIVITLVFTFLLLFGKEKYEVFCIMLYKDGNPAEVQRTINEITKVSQQYLTGRAISMSIQATLFSVGLSIIGVQNSVTLGCLAGLLSIFPYLGPVLGGLFPVLMSLLSEDISTTFWVLTLLVCVQVFDNYLVEPNVVGGKVNLSAFATILIIIMGGTLWGVAGMIMFVPILGIVKIIFTHVVALNHYAYLIGDPDEKEPSWISKCIHFFIKKNNKPVKEIY